MILLPWRLRLHVFRQRLHVVPLQEAVAADVVLVVVVVGLAIIQTHPPTVLFLLFLAYAISGPVLTLIQLRKHREQRASPERTEDEGEDEGEGDKDA